MSIDLWRWLFTRQGRLRPRWLAAPAGRLQRLLLKLRWVAGRPPAARRPVVTGAVLAAGAREMAKEKAIVSR